MLGPVTSYLMGSGFCLSLSIASYEMVSSSCFIFLHKVLCLVFLTFFFLSFCVFSIYGFCFFFVFVFYCIFTVMSIPFYYLLPLLLNSCCFLSFLLLFLYFSSLCLFLYMVSVFYICLFITFFFFCVVYSF